jgi:hypothetical protein
MTGPGVLDDLTTQLTDFLGLPADLDLPPLCHVQLERKQSEADWSARAQLARFYGQPAWEALHAWQAATGGTVDVSKPYTSGGKPFRTISIIVSVAGLEVRVWAHADADDPIPDWAKPPMPMPPVEYGECLDERMRNEPEALWLVWSHEHGAWWKPAKWSYTDDPQKAGRYSVQDAQEICAKAAYRWRGGLPPEVMVPASAPDYQAAIQKATDRAMAAKAGEPR